MGYPRAVHYAGALAALVLGGCNPVARQSDLNDYPTRDEVNFATSGLERRIADLEAEVASLREAHARQAALIASVANQVADNAEVANENAINEMTRRAACGTELVQLSNGTWQNRVIPCTARDLRPRQ